MKSIITQFRFSFLTLIAFFSFLNVQGQTIVSSDVCNSFGQPSEVSLKNSSGAPLLGEKTGLDFNLLVDVPGGICQGGHFNITVTTSANLQLGTQDPNYPFIAGSTPNQYVNGGLITSNSGQGINIPFRFLPGVTCNDELGTFDITTTLTCTDGSVKTCTFKQLSLKAIAQNYWKVEKTHVFGNLSGGGIYWDVIISSTNPNPGIGDLNIYSGSIQDVVSSDAIVSVAGGSMSGLTGLNTPTASWFTGTILSTTSIVIYHVQTYSCKPTGTVVKNCVNYDFCLGKEIKMHPYDPLEKKFPGGPVGPIQKLCCERKTGQACASVTLTGTATNSANFGKSLTYGTNLNYAQGCEGEYQINVSNNGNIPLNNLIITDNFPAGINVSQISVSAYNTTMGYDVPTGTPSSPYTTSGTNYSQSWSSGYPTNFKLTTNSGVLLGGSITILIKFTITAPAGTVISNCADLNFQGTYNGWSNWCNITLPPIGSGTASHSCIPFTVQQPKAIPGIRKCITNGLGSFSVGDVIPFRIVVSNHGAANFSGNLSDFLGAPTLQNLELVSGSVTYSYGLASFSPYTTTPGCISNFSNVSSTPPSWVSVTQQIAQDLKWTINNMPGDCHLETASYLIIEFNAKVKSQSFGNYCNTATLVNTATSASISSDACYNIRRSAIITTTKQESTTMVEPGQSFSYTIVVKNEGSVALKDITVEDALPDCVTYVSRSANKLDVSGNSTVASVTPAGAPPYTFPGLILQPGESVVVTINVIRKSNDQGAECCNPMAVGRGVSNDAVLTHVCCQAPMVCVKSGLCCDIKDLEVQFNTTIINGGIVPAFFITSGPLPVQEIDITLMDYHAEYSNPLCQPTNMGNLTGHIQPFVGSDNNNNYWDFNSLPGTGTPYLTLQTVINPVNSALTWTGTNPIDLTGSSWATFANGLIALNFIAPDILNLDCCAGRVYYCFKVRIKDVDCNVCEKIVCGSSEIPKKRQARWNNEKAKDQQQIQSLKVIPATKANGSGLPELFRIKNQIKK